MCGLRRIPRRDIDVPLERQQQTLKKFVHYRPLLKRLLVASTVVVPLSCNLAESYRDINHVLSEPLDD